MDYRKLKKMIIKNWYPLLHNDYLMDQLKGEVLFLEINLKSMYHHIRVWEVDIHKTFFRMRTL